MSEKRMKIQETVLTSFQALDIPDSDTELTRYSELASRFETTLQVDLEQSKAELKEDSVERKEDIREGRHDRRKNRRR